MFRNVERSSLSVRLRLTMSVVDNNKNITTARYGVIGES